MVEHDHRALIDVEQAVEGAELMVGIRPGIVRTAAGMDERVDLDSCRRLFARRLAKYGYTLRASWSDGRLIRPVADRRQVAQTRGYCVGPLARSGRAG